jgi:hypothetical protein
MVNRPTRPAERSPRRPALDASLFFVLVTALIALAGVRIFCSSFTGFAEYDDEGYVMIGLRSFLQGHALYDYVYSQYGPFYYLVEASIYALLHVEVTHNAVRALVAAFWGLSAVLSAWSTYRLTRSWILTALGFTGVVAILGFFTGSPGHPEEVCIALLIGVSIAASYLSNGAMIRVGCVLGALIAALTLTKINIGAYAALAIGLALLKAMSVGRRFQRVLFVTLAIAGLALPVIVMAPLLQQEWAKRIVVLLVLSLCATFLTVWHTETEQIVTPPVLVAGVSLFGVVAALIVAVFFLRGTTLSAMLYMTVLQYGDFAKNWYIPFSVSTELVPGLSLILAVAWVLTSGSSRARGPLIILLNSIKVFVSVAWCLNLRSNHFPLMYNFVVPFIWLVLVPPTSQSQKKQAFARLALCLLSVFSAMYLLPVAGAQIAFSLVLTVPIVCLFLDDGRALLVQGMRLRRSMQVIEIVAVVLLLATNGFWEYGALHRYRRLAPLALPGADLLHLPRNEAADYQQITAVLNSSCDSNFSMPGIFSLYFWTETAPPTNLLMSNWIGLLNTDQQKQVVSDLSHYKNLCIVSNPRLVKNWMRGQDLSTLPLARYIDDGFEPAMQVGAYVVLVRKR